MINIPHVPTENDPKIIMDENTDVTDNERLPLSGSLKVIRFRTIKKNSSLGWWSCVVLLEDHEKKRVCFYRWHKKDGEWKRDKKIVFKNRSEWHEIKHAIDGYINETD